MKNEEYLLQVYSKYPVTPVKGKGSYIWDENGKKYLDFYGGHAVCVLGHCPEKVVEAVCSQSKELLFYSNIFHTKPQADLACKLAKTLAPEKYQVYFANSGSEANETAIKIARKQTGKKHVISFKEAFHGRSITNLGVTGIDLYHKFNPNVDEFTYFAELGDMKSVEMISTDDVAAVICEPIQSVGGVNMAEKSFYVELAEYCKKHEILLIFDEVQTGMGRTGDFWFAQSVSVSPDIITTAKGLASGLPLSAVIVKKDVAEKVEVFDHATTFGGGPVACAAGLATVEIISTLGFLAEIKENSKYLKEKLESVVQVESVFGQGFLLGFELEEEVLKLVQQCLDAGIIIGSSTKKGVYRLTPPINVSKKEIDEFIDILENVLSNHSENDA